jgi:hypothetical protein
MPSPSSKIVDFEEIIRAPQIIHTTGQDKGCGVVNFPDGSTSEYQGCGRVNSPNGSSPES